MNNYPTTVRYLIRLLLILAIIAILIVTQQLLVPLFLSILLAYLLFPSAERMEKIGISRIATNFILVIGSVAIISCIAYLIIVLAVTVTDDLPTIKERIDTNITRFRWALGRTFGVTAEQLDSIVESLQGSGQYIADFFYRYSKYGINIGVDPCLHVSATILPRQIQNVRFNAGWIGS